MNVEDMNRMLLGLCNMLYILAGDFCRATVEHACSVFEEEHVLRWAILQEKSIMNALLQLKWELRRARAALEVTPDPTPAMYNILGVKVLSLGACFVAIVHAHFTPVETSIKQLCGLIKQATPLAQGLFYDDSEAFNVRQQDGDLAPITGEEEDGELA